MTARYPLVRVGADISELPAGDTLLGVVSSGSAEQLRQVVKNSTGAVLLKGQAVYISGASGTNVEVALARANTEATSSKTLGLIESNIAVNATGYVITEGALTSLDTSMALNEGDPIWLSPTTAGGLLYGLNNKPAAPYHMVYLGVVSRKNVSNGVILVKVQNGYELDELHNVLITTPVNGNVLKYDSVTSLWKNDVISAVTSVSGTGTVSGLTLTGTVTESGSLTLGGTLSVDYSSLNGTVPTWNQNTTGNAANVTGTIAVANGGTGVSTFTAGLLKANGTNEFITIPAPVGALVGTTDTQTLTNKTITAIAAYETKIAMAANAIDLSLGNCFSKTISATTTFTISNTPAANTAVVIILDLTNGGAFTLTWWSGVKWIGATVPTLTAAGRDMLGFITHDGGVTWSGIVLAKDIK